MIEEARVKKEADILLQNMKDLKAERDRAEEEYEKKREQYRMLMFSPKVYFDQVDKVLCA